MVTEMIPVMVKVVREGKRIILFEERDKEIEVYRTSCCWRCFVYILCACPDIYNWTWTYRTKCWYIYGTYKCCYSNNTLPEYGTLNRFIVVLHIAYSLMGLFIYWRNVPPIIVTLDMSFVWTGIAYNLQAM